jgi:TPR repeat protein
MCYYKGFGVEKDMVLAYAWFNLAVNSGHAESADMRDSIEKMLTREGVDKAQSMSHEGMNPRRTFLGIPY